MSGPSPRRPCCMTRSQFWRARSLPCWQQQGASADGSGEHVGDHAFHRQPQLLLVVAAPLDTAAAPGSRLRRGRDTARPAGHAGADPGREPRRPAAAAAARAARRVGIDRDLRVRLRARRARAARRACRARPRPRGQRGDARRLRGAARGLADERARRRAARRTDAGAGARPRAHHAAVGGMPTPRRRPRPVAVRGVLDRGRDVRAGGAALPDLRRDAARRRCWPTRCSRPGSRPPPPSRG